MAGLSFDDFSSAAPSKQGAESLWDFQNGSGDTSQDISPVASAAQGAVSGATAGFHDELTGASAVGTSGFSPEVQKNLHLSPVGHMLSAAGGGAKMLYDYLTGGSDQSVKTYQEARDKSRAEDAKAAAANPWAYGAGNVAGAAATLPFAPAAKVAEGANLGVRALQGAKTGAGYGALYGAGSGEGAVDTAKQTLEGAALGAGAGAAAPGILDVAGNLAGRAVAPFKGIINPTAEAERRTAAAIKAGNPSDPNAVNTAADTLEKANSSGVPLIAADTGGEPVRALARSAANTDQTARETLEAATMPRVESQKDRAKTLVQWIAGGNPEASLERENLLEAARQANKPAYQKAYAAGDKPIWSPELERLSNSPTIRDALRSVENKWADWQVVDGFGGMNPPVKVTPDGQFIKNTGGKGIPTYPNIQFWDYAARNVADAAQAARSAGSNQLATRLGSLEKQLKTELDKIVPEFGTARKGAARFFGADDALEAGENFVNQKMQNSEVTRAFKAMTPEEKELFRNGYASNLLKKIHETPDRNNLVNNAIFNNQAARERTRLALGNDGANRLEAFVRLERLMQMTSKAISGGSTTARQLAENGLAGGIAGDIGYGLYSGDYDPRSPGAMVGLALGVAKGRVNQNVVREVGRILASNDPQVLRNAADRFSKNPKMIMAIRNLDNIATRTAQTSASRLLPGPSPVRAQDSNQNQ